MFRPYLALFCFICASTGVLAQEQVAVRINEKGLLKVLKMAIQYNTSAKNSRSIIIPKNIYKMTVPKAQFASNPIVPIVNEISDLNLNKDINFYFQTSNINVTGSVDPKSIKTRITNSGPNGFDINVSVALPGITATAANMSLCETKAKNSKNCGGGLKATVSKLRISTQTRPIQLGVTLRLRTNGKVARVSVLSVSSNLESKTAPNVDINFAAVEVPKLILTVDGVSTELDTSKLKDEILSKKVFLAKKLLSFAGDFIASDLAEMLNVYLVNKEIVTQFQIYKKDNPVKFDEFLSDKRNYNSSYSKTPVSSQMTQSSNPNVLIAQISEIIRNAQVGIALKKISTPGNKDIELAGSVKLMLNDREIAVRNTLGNSARALPSLDLSAHRNHDVNLVISEPLINGALDLVNSTNLFQELFEAVSPVKGFGINNVKMHFLNDKTLVAVVNAQVDLKKIGSDNFVQWVKNKLAAWLERQNNNSVIYFPIEVSILPIFKKLPDGGTGMELRVLSPFNKQGLINRFNYNTNVPAMYDIVKEGVMNELKASIEPLTNKNYSVDLTKFLNQSGVVFSPRSISINQGSYLMLNLDLLDIKFNSKNPKAH